MTVTITANGQFPRKEYPRYLISSSDVIVCCDGALQTLEKHNIVPDIVIGDLDSICQKTLGRFKGHKVYDANQENNDLTKAFNYVMANFPEVTTIHIIGATGRSEAHTLGNLSLLMEYEKVFDLTARDIAVDMVSDWSTAFAISGDCELHTGSGRRISIFSPDSTLNIKSKGLEWPTDNVVFDNWWKASLNVTADDVVTLKFSHPAPALIILD